MLGQEGKVFGLPVELVFVLAFVAIFIIVLFLVTPQFSGSFLGYLFSGLQQLAALLGGF